MESCETFSDIDKLFIDYEANEDEFNTEDGLYNKYCPGKNGSKRCDTDYEKLGAIFGYAYVELVKNNQVDLDNGNDPSADFLVMALSNMLYKLSKNSNLSLKDAFKNHLNNQGSFNYSSILRNKKYFSDSNIGIMNGFYFLFQQICETINRYNSPNAQIHEHTIDITQFYIIYYTLYNFVKQCDPYLQLFNHLKTIYDGIINGVVKFNDNDQELRNNFKTLSSIDTTKLLSEFNTEGCRNVHKKIEQNTSRIKEKSQEDREDQEGQEGQEEEEEQGVFNTLIGLLGPDDDDDDSDDNELESNDDTTENSLNQIQNDQDGTPLVPGPQQPGNLAHAQSQEGPQGQQAPKPAESPPQQPLGQPSTGHSSSTGTQLSSGITSSTSVSTPTTTTTTNTITTPGTNTTPSADTQNGIINTQDNTQTGADNLKSPKDNAQTKKIQAGNSSPISQIPESGNQKTKPDTSSDGTGTQKNPISKVGDSGRKTDPPSNAISQHQNPDDIQGGSGGGSGSGGSDAPGSSEGGSGGPVGGKDSGGGVPGSEPNGGSKAPRDQAVTHPSEKSNSGWLGIWGTNFNPMSYIPSPSSIYETPKNILASTANKITSAYSNTVDNIKHAYNRTVDSVTNAYNNTMTVVKDTYNSTMTNITNAYTASTNYISGAVSSITNQLSSLGTFSQLGDDQSELDGPGNSLPTDNNPANTTKIPNPDPNSPSPSITQPQSPLVTSPPLPPPLKSLPSSPLSPVTSSDPQTLPDTGSPKSLDPQPISTQFSKSSDQQSTSNDGKGVSQIPLSAQVALPSFGASPLNIGNRNKPSGTDVKINKKLSIWCIGSNTKCDILYIGITGISIFVFLAIIYKYLPFRSGKNSKKKKSMKRVIKYGDGTRKTQIIIKSYDRNKNLKPIINSVDRKKDSLLNIYKLMQADPIPFINLFFLLIFFVYKRKLNYLEL
ncbi:CIR protein PIR protein [Plasmodium vinckei vinckei]|uniref:CIR protein PIR protein n=1 Tax=Plasmodium vinckei vinckei TaxID=54757 RepID=A0A449BUN2_PLAVN|nr:CIR protein PIR protein [Plasmodium vinckei vinckei]VEV57128.1 CIR protein PIR protein [Plasmodium vinckei vinckei]